MWQALCELGYTGSYRRVCAFARLWKIQEGLAAHQRCFDRSQTLCDWQHYISLLERKSGGLRNGAPFETMPAAFKLLQAILMRKPGGDAVMAQVLAAVPVHGLEAVLVAAELALESGKPSGEQFLNVLARLKSNTPAANLGEAMAAELVHLPLKLRVEPTANVARYDGLRQSVGPSAVSEGQP